MWAALGLVVLFVFVFFVFSRSILSVLHSRGSGLGEYRLVQILEPTRATSYSGTPAAGPF